MSDPQAERIALLERTIEGNEKLIAELQAALDKKVQRAVMGVVENLPDRILVKLNNELEADNTRLREALEKIAESDTALNGPFTECADTAIRGRPMRIARDIAQAAVAPSTARKV